MIAIRPSKMSMPPMIAMRQPAKPIHPVHCVFLAIAPPCAFAVELTLCAFARAWGSPAALRAEQCAVEEPDDAALVRPRVIREALRVFGVDVPQHAAASV